MWGSVTAVPDSLKEARGISQWRCVRGGVGAAMSSEALVGRGDRAVGDVRCESNGSKHAS